MQMQRKLVKMQEVHYIDENGENQIQRKFFAAKTKRELSEQLREAYNDAMSFLPNIIQLTQKEINLKDPCPCGKSKSFEMCCYWKVIDKVPITPYKNDNEK
jgi:uncharacterized protein YchJ